MAKATAAAPREDTIPRFAKWISDVGARQIAEELRDVTKWSVMQWRTGAINLANGRPLAHAGGTRPRPERLGEIIKFAKGALTAADIYPNSRRT